MKYTKDTHWIEVELFRWQYGRRPYPDKQDLELDVPMALRAMAEALEDGCRTGKVARMPRPDAVTLALKYCADLLEEKRK